MGYIKADEILPVEVIEIIQQYVEGKNIYIPKKDQTRREWGSGTQIRQELHSRNNKIMSDFFAGVIVRDLACKYYLSEKSIQRIIRNMKEKNHELTT